MSLNFTDDLFADDDSSSPFEGGGSYNGVSDPYIGPARLTAVQIAEINDKQNLEFVFECTDEAHAGQTHSHIIWEPEPGHPQFNEERFKKNTGKFLLHMLYRFSNEETEEDRQLWARKHIVANGWLPLCRQVIAALESVNYTEKEDLEIKIPGSVYKGKARLKIPPWPFTIDSRSNSVLRWSKKELIQNQEYLAKVSQIATTPAVSDDVDDSALTALEDLDETI
jgi:hypothetical protein